MKCLFVEGGEEDGEFRAGRVVGYQIIGGHTRRPCTAFMPFPAITAVGFAPG